MPTTAKQAFYIKLGRGGGWESECLRNGTLRLGYRETPHDLCVAGAWDEVREFWTEKKGHAGTGTSFARQIRTFYETDETALFITFARGLLYWCTPTGPVELLADNNRRRATVDGWHSRSVKGTPLTSDRISGHLLKVQMFQGTICRVKPLEYLLRKLNDELSPEVAAAEEAERALMDAIVRLMRLLTWQDFELLVDLMFSASGWRRIGVVGRVQKTVDLELILPTTGERAFVQIKSQANNGDLQDYADRFHQRKVPTEPEAIIEALQGSGQVCERIGLEAGPLSQWLYGELAEAGLPVICIETRHIRAVLEAQVNKTDRNDARGIAQMMRVGLFRAVHVKTLQSQQRRMLLTTRKLLQSKMLDLENDLRGTLKNFGFKVGKIGAASFEARVRELVDGYPALRAMVIPVLVARAALREQFKVLHALLLRLVRNDRACRLLMTAPGVGPVAAMTFRATVDVPARFRKSKAVGAHFGLTPRKHQSGEVDRTGRISKRGDRMVRTALFEAAQAVMIRLTRWCTLKAWGMKIARKRGLRRAIVAVARRLGVILHRMWASGTAYRWGQPATA